MKIVKKLPITLLEMLLVLGLISIIAGLVGLNVRHLLKEERFKSEVYRVLDLLRLAEDLMLIAESDTYVKFMKDSETGGILYQIEVEKPLSTGWSKELLRKRTPLNAIKWIEFQDASLVRLVNPLELKFLSGGSEMSEGTLRLADSDRNPVYQSFICLPGYPANLNISTSPCELKKDIEFRQKLTFISQREILEREQKDALTP